MLVLNLCSGYFRLAQRALPVDFVVSSYFNVFVKIFWKVYIWKRRNYLLRFVGNKLLGSWGGLVFARSDAGLCGLESAVSRSLSRLTDR